MSQPQTKEEGMRMLMTAFQERLFANLFRMLKDEDQAKDALQECFIKVWNKFDSFNKSSSLYTWIYRIATNEGLQILRKQKPSEDISELPLSQGNNELNGTFILEQLYAALNELPEKQRLVFHLRYFEELSYEAISNITGGSIGGLKANYHHAVKKIEIFLTSD